MTDVVPCQVLKNCSFFKFELLFFFEILKFYTSEILFLRVSCNCNCNLHMLDCIQAKMVHLYTLKIENVKNKIYI